MSVDPVTAAVAGGVAGLTLNEFWQELKKDTEQNTNNTRQIVELLARSAAESPPTVIDLSLGDKYVAQNRIRGLAIQAVNPTGAAINIAIRVGARTNTFILSVPANNVAPPLELYGFLFDRGTEVRAELFGTPGTGTTAFVYLFANVEKEAYNAPFKQSFNG